MKNVLRLVALLMACLFCVLAVASCKDDDKKPGPSTPQNDGEVIEGEDGNRYDEWGKIWDDLPDNLNYDGERIKVHYWSDVVEPEFEQAEETDDARLSAIFNRNNTVESRLGITIRFTSEPGDSSNVANFVKSVENKKENGTQDYDIIATYSRTMGTLASRCMLMDLNGIENSYIDYEKPWWPENMVENFTIGKSLYFVSGDIAATAIDNAHCIYFNKTPINEKFSSEAELAGVEDGSRLLYKYVRDGEWTIDKLIEMTMGVYEDADMNGELSPSDKYGFSSIDYCAATLYGGANLRLVQHDDAKTLIVSPDFTSARTTLLVQKIGAWLTTDCYWHGQTGSYYNPFLRGNGLFILNYMCMAERHLVGNDAIDHYGILPMPKYNAEQVNYYTPVGNAFSVYGIFIDCDSRGNMQDTLTMLTAVLECWGSQGYRQVTPIIFELNMQLKYSETQDETDMCEFVRAGMVFDIGRLIDHVLGESLDRMFIRACEVGADWTTAYSSQLPAVEDNLKTMVDALLALQNPT